MSERRAGRQRLVAMGGKIQVQTVGCQLDPADASALRLAQREFEETERIARAALLRLQAGALEAQQKRFEVVKRVAAKYGLDPGKSWRLDDEGRVSIVPDPPKTQLQPVD